jgi:hypothetical protein
VAVIDYVASLNEIRFQGMIRAPSAVYRNFEHFVMIFLLSPGMLQSVRRHSARVLKVSVNGMLEIRPVICLLLKLNRN